MINAIQSQVSKSLGQVRQTFLGIVARGGSKLLQLTGYADETLQNIELIQHVGFASFVPKGAKVVVIPLQGKTSRSVVIATTGGTVTVDVGDGETCIYNQHGHTVWLKADGTHIGGGDVFIDAGNLEVSGNITSGGDISDKKGSMQSMRTTYNGHSGHGSGGTPSAQM